VAGATGGTEPVHDVCFLGLTTSASKWWKALAEAYPRLVNLRRQPTEPAHDQADAKAEPDRSEAQEIRKH
jgi:hypothetical protein